MFSQPKINYREADKKTVFFSNTDQKNQKKITLQDRFPILKET